MDGISFTPRLKRKRAYYCAVENCRANSNGNLNLSFHFFPSANQRTVKVNNYFGNPENINIFAAWKNATNIKIVQSYTRVCSRHFTKHDYFFPEVSASRRILKKIAVPSCNLPHRSLIKTESVKRRKERLEKRVLQNKEAQESSKNDEEQRNQNSEDTIHEEMEFENFENEAESQQTSDIEKYLDVDGKIYMYVGLTTDRNERKFADVGVQVGNDLLENYCEDVCVELKSGDLKSSFVDCIKTDANLSTVTGIESFSILACILQLASCFHVDLDNGTVKMSLRDKIVMTYLKLKHNVSYALLAVLFDCCSERHCARIFKQTICLLNASLKPAIPWPSRDEISKNIPLCFKDFRNVRIVLDCTEIFIQNPKNLCCKILTYSHYKKGETVKFLTGVTPAGNISFVSQPYGGRASDKAIFKQSELINLLESGDEIMVDKGFLIENVCDLHGFKCIRPPFLRNEKQFSKAESLLTQNIASARVHIERSNQRIKNFEVVGGVMPSHLVRFVSEIFTVICATVNLSAPILSDEKFMSSNKNP